MEDTVESRRVKDSLMAVGMPGSQAQILVERAANGMFVTPTGSDTPRTLADWMALLLQVAGSYNPVTELGSDLIAYWDANRGDLITSEANAISAWVDVVGGFSLAQGTADYKPLYSPTSFNNTPGITGDGVDDYLTCTDAGLLAALPTGANPSEIWVLFSQAALPADTTERFAVAYGGTSLITGRAISRIVTSGTNRTRSRTGNGAASTNISDTVVDLSGAHVVRQVVGATSTSLYIDGGSAVTASVVPSTTASRLRAFSSSASAPTGYGQCTIAAILVTLPLSPSKASGLQAYLGSR